MEEHEESIVAVLRRLARVTEFPGESKKVSSFVCGVGEQPMLASRRDFLTLRGTVYVLKESSERLTITQGGVRHGLWREASKIPTTVDLQCPFDVQIHRRIEEKSSLCFITTTPSSRPNGEQRRYGIEKMSGVIVALSGSIKSRDLPQSATVRVVRESSRRLRSLARSLVVSCRAEEFKRLFNSFYECRELSMLTSRRDVE